MHDTTHSSAPAFDKDHPFLARLTENRLLNKAGTIKDTRHLVVDISGSGLSYTCGDSLGVYPENRPEDVEELLALLDASPDDLITLPRSEERTSIREAIRCRLSVSGPTRKLLTTLLDKCGDLAEKTALEGLLALDADQLKLWLEARHFADVLAEFPKTRLTAQEFAELSRKLMPRLYSIASAPAVTPDEVHLTVAVVRYESLGKSRVGVCSSFLADRVPLHEPVLPVFVASSHFGLPDDPDADLIMVGPGTGIAPFRSFLLERRARASKGRNWLFFGDQHAATDFLYGDELTAMHNDGFLNRLDCAWSRDQAQKIYVQDKMRAAGAELAQWIKDGAYFYVCGDAKRMAKDVDLALHEILAEHLGLDEEAAKAFVKDLKKSKRYQRDVY